MVLPFWLKHLLLFFVISSLVLLGCGGEKSSGDPADDDDDDNPVVTGWTATDGPLGGNINQILVSPDNFFREINRAYIVGPGSIFYTTNAGTTWASKKNNLPSGEIQSISAVTANIFFIGMKDKGIYLTRNGGATWTSANPTGFVADEKDFLAILAVSETIYFVGVNEATTAKFYRVELDNTWESTDMTMTYTPQPQKIYAIVARQRNPQQHFYVATDVDVFLTLNGGQTWRDKADWIPGATGEGQGKGLYEMLGDKAQVYSLFLLQSTATSLPFTTEILYAGIQDTVSTGRVTYKILWRFNGREWQNKFSGDTFKDDKVVALAVAKVEEDDQQKERVYAGLSKSGLYLSKDGSIETPEWKARNEHRIEGQPVPIALAAPGVTSLAVGFQQGESRVEDIIYRGNRVYGIMYESDGAGFVEKETKLRNSIAHALWMKSDEKKVFAATNSGIHIKEAAVDTWKRSSGSITGNGSQYIGIVGSNDGINLLAATSSAVYQSGSSGDTWIDAKSDFEGKEITCLAGNMVKAWVGLNDGSVWYRDDTNTWSKLQSPPGAKVYDLVYANNQGNDGTLYAGTNLGIFSNSKPDNTSEVWSAAFNTGLIQNKTVRRIAVNHDGTKLLASVMKEGAYYYEPARGEWVLRDANLTTDAKKIYAIVLYNNEVFLGTDDGIWYNEDITDDTKVWVARNSRLSDKKIRSIIIYAADRKIMYIGTEGGGVYKTESSGE